MIVNDKQVRMELYLLSRANEEIAALENVPGSPLDSEILMHRHLHMWPKDFAYEEWLSYQPAIRKIRLLPTEQSGQCGRASNDVC